MKATNSVTVANVNKASIFSDEVPWCGCPQAVCLCQWTYWVLVLVNPWCVLPMGCRGSCRLPGSEELLGIWPFGGALFSCWGGVFTLSLIKIVLVKGICRETVECGNHLSISLGLAMLLEWYKSVLRWSTLAFSSPTVSCLEIFMVDHLFCFGCSRVVVGDHVGPRKGLESLNKDQICVSASCKFVGYIIEWLVPVGSILMFQELVMETFVCGVFVFWFL